MSVETEQTRLGELPCGHLAEYLEDGECLRCNQSFNTPEERAVERELVGEPTRRAR